MAVDLAAARVFKAANGLPRLRTPTSVVLKRATDTGNEFVLSATLGDDGVYDLVVAADAPGWLRRCHGRAEEQFLAQLAAVMLDRGELADVVLRDR